MPYTINFLWDENRGPCCPQSPARRRQVVTLEFAALWASTQIKKHTDIAPLGKARWFILRTEMSTYGTTCWTNSQDYLPVGSLAKVAPSPVYRTVVVQGKCLSSLPQSISWHANFQYVWKMKMLDVGLEGSLAFSVNPTPRRWQTSNEPSSPQSYLWIKEASIFLVPYHGEKVLSASREKGRTRSISGFVGGKYYSRWCVISLRIKHYRWPSKHTISPRSNARGSV